MKCLISKGFKYLVALFIILSCVSVRAMAKETSDTAKQQGNRITEKENTTKNETFDTNDEMMSNEPKKVSSTDSASGKGEKSEASTIKDSKKDTYTFEDQKIKVKAVLENADAVSDLAELKVKEIPENTTEYKKYEKALTKDAKSSSNVLLYDISFILNGKEVEPADGTVKVSMEFKDKQLSDSLNVKSASDLKIIHFKDNDLNKQESLQPTTNVKNEMTSFETKSFSAYAVIKENQNFIGQKELYYTNQFEDPDLGYGITANSIYQTGDTETNVFTGLYDSNVKELGASGTSTFGKDAFSNAGGYDYIGDFGTRFGKDNNKYLLQFYMQPKLLTLGSAATAKYDGGQYSISCKDTNTEINPNLIQRESNTQIEDGINLTVKNQLEKMKKCYTDVITNSVANRLNKINTDFPQGGSKKLEIDIRNQASGTYIIEYDGSVIGSDNLTVKLNKDQKIIFYCTNTSITIGRYFVETTINGKTYSKNTGDLISEKGEDYDWLCKAVSFYAPNATTLNFSDSVCGAFIAPLATVTKNDSSTCAGIMACMNYGTAEKPLGGEWHYHNHNLPSPADIQFEGKKQFTDNKWPESGNYTLNLTAEGDDTPLPSSGTSLDLSKTKTNGQFGKIIYSADENKEGKKVIYEYKISENKGSVANVTYDSKVYKVRVEVTYDTDGSALVTNTSYKRVKDGTDLDADWVPFTTGYQFTFTNSVENEHKLLLQVNKKDETGKQSLTGAVFNLKKDGDSGEGKTINTGNQSKAIFKDIDTDSTYTLTETKAPINYQTSGPWKVVTNDDSISVYLVSDSKKSIIANKMSNDNYAFTVDIKNDLKKFGFKLRKTDESTGQLITDNSATFTLTKIKSIDSSNVMTLESETKKLTTTLKTGFVNVSDILVAGQSYYLEETKAPDGYSKSGPWIIEVNDSGATFYTVKNTNGVISEKTKTGTSTAKNDYLITYTVSDKKKEYTLPSTGGNGTKTYYMVGTLLSVLGIIYVVFKKGKGGLLRNKKNL